MNIITKMEISKRNKERINIYIDEEYLGDLMSHVNKKRGKVLETDSLDDGLIKLKVKGYMIIILMVMKLLMMI